MTVIADERRAYWRQMMEAASAFMAQARRVPIEECGDALEDLATCERHGARWDVAATALGELGGAFMRRSLVPGFVQAVRALNNAGLEPVVKYAYRTPAMQRSLLVSAEVLDQVVERVSWEWGTDAVPASKVYERLIVLCANSFATGTHLAGTAVDVVIRDLSTGEPVEMGGPYLEMSERTPMDSPFISEAARANRVRCIALFATAGFYPYPYEFWHYSRDDVYGVVLGRQAGPARFGPVNVNPATGAAEPIDEPAREIEDPDVMVELISARLLRAEP